MSFLKQLLKPFVEFDADNPQGQQNVPPAGGAQQPPPKAPAQPSPPPQQKPPASAPPKAAAPLNPAPARPVPVPPKPAPPPAIPPPKAATPPPPPPQSKPATPVQPPAPKPAAPVQLSPPAFHHPMIEVSGSKAGVPTFSPSGTLVKPLPVHVQYFEELIDEANRTNPLFRGADYKEFVDSKFDIDDITDEALKYRTAYNVLQGTGLTKEKLLMTGQEYINLIGRDMNAFQGAFAIKYSREVQPKEAQVQKKAAELQALVQRMNALKTEINQLTQDMTLVKEQLNTTKASFLLAGENKQVEIDAELQKIAQYFQE